MSIRRWIRAPIRIDRAIAATAGDGYRAVVIAIVFAVPTHNVASVDDGAPSRIASLIGEAWPHVDAQNPGGGRDDKR